MKKFFWILISIFALTHSATAQDAAISKWEQANVAYADEDFALAARHYESLLTTGSENWELYYNLGAAYYKDGELGRAILNFERALVLNPRNEDIEHNLAVARAHTVDKIDSVPRFFLLEWLSAARDSMSVNVWTMVMIIFIAGGSVFFILWRLKRSKTALWFSVAMGSLALISLLFAHSAYAKISSSDAAIILNSASVVRSSPATNGKELFVLHEGTKVELLEQNGDYSEIRIASGSKGWVISSDISQI